MIIDVTSLIEFVITFILALLTYYAVPWIKEKRLETWIRIGCSAAEQIYKAGHGAEKKEYVLDFLATKGIKVDNIAVDNMIEAFVFEMNAALKK